MVRTDHWERAERLQSRHCHGEVACRTEPDAHLSWIKGHTGDAPTELRSPYRCDHDSILGRIQDGGYDLIAVRGCRKELLDGVPMSTTTAADAVTARAAERGLGVAVPSLTFDVDEAADLALLREKLEATWTALNALQLPG